MPSSAPPSAVVPTCPHVIDTNARLSYDCITPGMSASFGATIWTVEVTKGVDKNWVLDEASGPINASAGGALSTAADLLTDLLVDSNYGDNPSAKTEASRDLTVSGNVSAHLVQTLITLSPAYVAAQGLKVKSERLWVLVVQPDFSHRSAFMISVPDVVSQLWPSVPGLINRIKVG
jgi:hypothetical protein